MSESCHVAHTVLVFNLCIRMTHSCRWESLIYWVFRIHKWLTYTKGVAHLTHSCIRESCRTHCAQRRSFFTYLDLRINPVLKVDVWMTGTPLMTGTPFTPEWRGLRSLPWKPLCILGDSRETYLNDVHEWMSHATQVPWDEWVTSHI